MFIIFIYFAFSEKFREKTAARVRGFFGGKLTRSPKGVAATKISPSRRGRAKGAFPKSSIIDIVGIVDKENGATLKV